MGRLDEKVAIVTGAGQGIGRGIARRFASEGAAVVVAERGAASGAAVAGELRDLGARAEFVATDVTDKAQVLAMVERTAAAFGRVDILVNNAWGGGSFCRLEQKTDADLQQALNVAVFGAFWAMQAVFPHMRRQGGGRIITLCSLNGVNAHMYTAEYNAAKEASRALARTAASRLP